MASREDMKGLEHNWDSYGAPPISHIAIAYSEKLIEEIWEYFNSLGIRIPQPFVSPVPDGRVQLEWESVNGDIEVIVDERGRLEWLLCKGGFCIEGKVKSPKDLAVFLRMVIFTDKNKGRGQEGV